MLTYQWTSAFLGTLFAIATLYLIRRNHLHSRYALWWLPFASVVALLGIFPSISDWIAPLLGISYPPVLVLVLGMGIILIKLLVMDIERSRNEVKLQRLVQRVAMLEGRMDEESKQVVDE